MEIFGPIKMIKFSRRNLTKFALSKSYSKFTFKVKKNIEEANVEPSFDVKIQESSEMNKRIQDLFKLAKEKGVEMNEEGYNIVFSYYTNMLSSLLDEMKKNEVLPDYEQFKTLLEKFAEIKDGKIQEDQILKSYLSCFRDEIAYYYNQKFQKFCSNQDYINAIKVYEILKEKDLKLETKTCNGLLEMVSIDQKPEVFAYMKDNDLVPDVETYNHMIEYETKLKKDLKKAEEVLDTMKNKGIIPNYATFLLMVDYYSSNDLIPYALEMLNNMYELGFDGLLEIYNIVLKNSFSNKEMLETVVKDMEKKRISKNSVSYSLEINYYIEKKDTMKIDELLEIVQRENIILTIFSYLPVFEYYLKSKQYSKAEKLYSQLREKDYEITGEIYQAFFFEYAKSAPEAFEKKLQDYKKDGLPMNGTVYITMLENYTLTAQGEKILETLEEIDKSQVEFSKEERDLFKKYLYATEQVLKTLKK